MSNCLQIIRVIGSCVTFGGFPCRFSKYCFHSFILSCWFAAFNFALVVVFLLLTSFIVCQAILDCLSSTESLILSIWFCMYSVSFFRYIDTQLTKAWKTIDRLSIIWKSDLTDKMKRSFFQATVVSILLYGCITWMLTKRLEKKLDGNYTRMLRAIFNKSWRQHPTRHQLYGHLPPITKTIQVRRTHTGHCWRSRDELISDVLLWTPTYGRAKAGRPARTYIQQLCEDTGCSPEDLPEAMNNREKWRERFRNIRARWCYIYIYIYIYIYTNLSVRAGCDTRLVLGSV